MITTAPGLGPPQARPFLQAESIETLGKLTESGELRFADFLEGVGASELSTLYRQLRQGVGIGLAAVREIREDLGGDGIMPALIFEPQVEPS